MSTISQVKIKRFSNHNFRIIKPKKAAVYEEFGQLLSIHNVADPTPEEHGVVIEVKANGID